MRNFFWFTLVLLVILCAAGCTGVSDTNRTGQMTNAPVHVSLPAQPVSPPPVPTVPASDPKAPLSGLTPAPAHDENLTARLLLDRDIIVSGETVSFRVKNQGDHVLVFSCGEPYHLERQVPGGWVPVTGAGGTMAFWQLTPGETSRTFSWGTGEPHWASLYENTTQGTRYSFSPGRYRIVLEALLSIGRPGEDIPVTYSREFVIREKTALRVPPAETRQIRNFAPDEIPDPEQVARIALLDPSARAMTDAGGEILGVRMAVKRSTATREGGVFPALLIRYNGLEADFLVDLALQEPVGRTIQVPSGAMIHETLNRTAVEYNGTVLFVFESPEAAG